MKAPAFQFYAGDFVSGTVDMNTEEIGAYILLLCYQWNKGGIPDDDRLIARITGTSQASANATAKSKFRLHADGQLRNDRMEIERAKQYEFRKKQSENAQKPRKPISQASAKPQPSHAPELAKPQPSSPSPIAPTIGDGGGQPIYAEIPSWDEFWTYAQHIGCHGEAFCRDKYHAADQQHWQYQRNWRGYVNRVKGWWEEKGRPMNNGKAAVADSAHVMTKAQQDEYEFKKLNKARIDSGLEPLPPRVFK